ncbi:hypothetical protein N7474_008983 [Penicillium riverlandense]|uniref:uncharacterized protein n=1 Tax=Penicillium riverlandense TaxID=1903569 RepID=UPI0025476CEF|nr:uncharacterized protein N7474_008983 [Penicillium riverlandense]KAJ5812682.1 hypothetical protein N7474_008983 [Penicillium riverlandense]
MVMAAAETKGSMKTVGDKTLDTGPDDNSIIVVEEPQVVVHLQSSDLRCDMNVISLICFGFSLSSSWAALSLSSVIAIIQGGTVTLLYGTIVVALPYLCTGLTLAELISVYPTAGGQYHFAYILAPARWRKSLSYISGLASLCAWFSISAGTFLITAEIIIALVIQFHPDYVPQGWHYFLLYETFNIFATVYNICLVKKYPRIYNVAFLLSMVGVIVIPIVCLARAERRQPSNVVWTTFTNNTGWTDSICFITGLVTPAFSFGGLDATMHLVEETLSPKKAVSRAICYTVGMGFVTAFLFVIATVYCIQDIDIVVATPTRLPIYELWMQATQSTAAATTFIVLLLTIDLIVCVATVQTMSRLTWALGRDNAFVWSHYLAQVHPKLEVPLWSLIADGVIVGFLGCLYLVSTVGIASQLLQFAFAIPIALLVWQKRSPIYLPKDREFRLSNPVGYFCHFVAICWAIFICVFFMFPPNLPVSASSMNYAAVVVFIAVLVGIGNWFAHACKHFEGPIIEFRE